MNLLEYVPLCKPTESGRTCVLCGHFVLRLVGNRIAEKYHITTQHRLGDHAYIPHVEVDDRIYIHRSVLDYHRSTSA